MKIGTKFVIGIDEVGRGSLAGPVVVAAAAIPKNLGFRIKNLGKLKDSKKLTAKQRERWFEYFKNHPRVSWDLARVYPRAIERVNISRAANLAATRAILRLLANSKRQRANQVNVFLDGGLYLNNKRRITQTTRRTMQKKIPRLSASGPRLSARTIVRGDEKITAIKIASIVAKVSRDRMMTHLAQKHPQYGFEIHKGYGTRAHFAAIRKYGPSIVHRKTFLQGRQ